MPKKKITHTSPKRKLLSTKTPKNLTSRENQSPRAEAQEANSNDTYLGTREDQVGNNNADTSVPVQRNFNESHPYYHILNQVVDPETGIGIADMGIIYDIKDEDGILDVTMTLTSMGCPAGPQITTDIDGVLRLQPQVKDVEIQIVWDPPWTPDMMNPEIRAMLFGGF